MWQLFEWTSEIESNLRDTVDWGRKWFVHFNAGKIQMVSLDQSNNISAIYVKMVGSVLEEKLSFKILGYDFSSKLDCIGALTLSLLLKLSPIKMGS